MDTLEFLQAVWPADGIYCLASPFTPDGAAKAVYQHSTYTDIEAAVRGVGRVRDEVDVFFAVHTLRKHKVWSETKRCATPLKTRKRPDGSVCTGDFGAYETRAHDNMSEARCFFFDLDVGETTKTTPKYETRQEALDGLEEFLFRTQLPTPLITSSGGGFHVYFRLTEPIESVEWRRHAAALHHIAKTLGLRADPARTTDQSSVLRVVGTFNRKPGHEPRPCVAIAEGVETETAVFVDGLAGLAARHDYSGSVLDAPVRGRGVGPGNLIQEWDGPVSTLDELREVCEHVRDYCEEIEAGGNPEEPVWYTIGCGLLQHTEEGVDAVLQYTKTTRDDAQTLMKLDQWNDRTGGMPPTCANIDSKCGGDACTRCPVAALGKNPLLIASALRKRRALPPPVVDEVVEIVDPPHPYRRTKDGFALVTYKDEGGVEIEDVQTIFPYDIYPIDVCARTELEASFSMWVVELPIVGQRYLKITSALMQDLRALHAHFLDFEVHVTPKQVEKMREGMQHWLRTLQKKKASNRQFDHIGWVDKTYTEFILPGTLLNVDGEERPCRLSARAAAGAKAIKQAGALEQQVSLLDFYNNPRYLRHQFMALCGLASPLLHATGLFGVIVNAEGESGGSKSTALYTAASFWGHPTEYTANGTNKGDTMLRQLERVFTLANLPSCLDEITRMDPEAAQDWAFNASQETERGRLGPDGTPKPVREMAKSSFILCSSNGSLHDKLNIDNDAGTAGSMRVFEINFPVMDETDLARSHAYIQGIKENFGHIGPGFLRVYMKRREEIDSMVRVLRDQIDKMLKLRPSERFWSATIACALVAGEVARRAGLLPFDTKAIRDWLFTEQLPYMRGVVGAEQKAASPAALISAFMNDRAPNTIIMETAGGFAQRAPQGALELEHVLSDRVMHVRKDAFRKWCERSHKHALQTLRQLEQSGAVVHMDRRRTLGQGTTYAAGRAFCFTVDLTHADLATVVTPTAGKVVPFPTRERKSP